MQTLQDRNLSSSPALTAGNAPSRSNGPRDPISFEGSPGDNDKHRVSISSSRSSHTDNSHGEGAISSKPKLQRVAGKTKEVSRRLFSTTSAGKRQDKLQDVARDGGLATQALKEDPAFNPHLLDTKQRHKKDLAAKVQENLQTAAASILHPKRGAKGKAARSTAGRLSRVERPYISQNMDIEFLEAHDNLSQAQSDALSGKNTLDEEAGSATGDCRERVEHLEAQRESIRAAHTMRRHVQRVRVVPKRHINLPAEDCFVERDDNGQRVRYDWLKWLGYVGFAYGTGCAMVAKDIRICFITLRTSLDNILMTSMSYHLTLVAFNSKLSVWL